MRRDSRQIKNDRTKTDVAKMRTCDSSATITWTMLSIDKVVHLWVNLRSISHCRCTGCGRHLNISPIIIARVLDCLRLQLEICDTFLCGSFCALSSQSFFLVV